MLKSHLYLVFPRAMCIVACLAAGPDINGIKEKLRRAKRHSLSTPHRNRIVARIYSHVPLTQAICIHTEKILRRFYQLPFLKGVVNCFRYLLVLFLVIFLSQS